MLKKHFFYFIFVGALICLNNIALGANRSHLSVVEALIGNWSFTYQTWYGKTETGDTVHSFYPDGTYLMIEKKGTTRMHYSILDENEKENWIMVYVTNLSTGKGHHKLLEFSHDKLSAKETIYFSYKNVRRKQKNTTMNSTWHYLGRIENKKIGTEKK
jgi:hypothetical protein